MLCEYVYTLLMCVWGGEFDLSFVAT